VLGATMGDALAAMSIQCAKNRECDGVIVLWPSAVGGGAEQKRRLLYVVITRTTRWCHVLVLALHFACTTSCGFTGALA
jgi:superfamily I DNA and RNA helicase